MYILTWLNFTFLEAETLRLYFFIMDCCVLISYQCISMCINVTERKKCAGAEARNGVALLIEKGRGGSMSLTTSLQGKQGEQGAYAICVGFLHQLNHPELM